MVRSHHEHYDGSGYPDGLAGNEIPIESRILSVVDTFRALMSEGPYRRVYSLEEARAEIESGAGAAFDPVVVKAFGTALDDLGARAEKHELMLDGFERELERERNERRKKLHEQEKETTREEAR